MHHHYERMKNATQTCWECRHECQETLFTHCLEMGGAHVEAAHVRLMTDCIQICQISADFMVRNSPFHAGVCAVCADICDACAISCDAIQSEEMKRCAEICRRCAASCREMSEIKHAA
jgi:hypothetical protein